MFTLPSKFRNIDDFLHTFITFGLRARPKSVNFYNPLTTFGQIEIHGSNVEVPLCLWDQKAGFNFSRYHLK